MSMACYIIILDISDQSRYQKALDIIKSYENHAQICSTTWAVVAGEMAADIRDRFNEIIDEDDRFFVIKSGAEAGWANVICDKSWLHQFIPNEF